MVDVEFRTRVQQRVDELGGESVRLAEASGLERNFIRDILTGKKKTVRASSIAKLAEALQCDPFWLQTGERQAPDLEELIRIYRRLSDRGKKALVQNGTSLEELEREPPQ